MRRGLCVVGLIGLLAPMSGCASILGMNEGEPAPEQDGGLDASSGGSAGQGGGAGTGGQAGSAGLGGAGGGSGGSAGASGDGGSAGSAGCATDCNDFLSCTADNCVGGACQNHLDTNSCLIAAACVAPEDTNPSNPCESCRPSASQYKYSPMTDGANCGSSKVCKGGVCGDCTEGQDCTPSAACKSGKITCSSGAPVCNESGNAPDGTSCGTSQVCKGGACVACVAGNGCTPANPCRTGITSCSTGEQSCLEKGTIADGKACEVSGICNAGSCFKCPTGKGGSTLVPMSGGYCIDATEVTRDQYNQWLATNPSTTGRPPVCTFNTTFAASSSTCLSASCTQNCGSHPMTCIDWCDAHAYCADQGKRLCGKVGGGAYPYQSPGITTDSQWYNACSAGGQELYVYGDNYVLNRCVVNEGGSSAVMYKSDCHSKVQGYLSTFDMIGNVKEWMDSCQGTSGQYDYCLVSGGSYFTSNAANDAKCSSTAQFDRAAAYQDIGFRCCTDP